MSLPDVAHHDVDEGVLYEAQEHEEGAGGHEHVNGLDTERSGGKAIKEGGAGADRKSWSLSRIKRRRKQNNIGASERGKSRR
jgi:hypothetical protein